MPRYLAPSSDAAKPPYTVTLNEEGVTKHCTCPSFHVRQRCRHVDEVSAHPEHFREVATTIATRRPVAAELDKPLPMLAKTLPEGWAPPSKDAYAVEEKFDGHRLLVRVQDGTVTSWSRLGNDSDRKLHPLMKAQLATMPNGVYDGELVVHGGHSYTVATLTSLPDRVFVVFDILELLGDKGIAKASYDVRRQALQQIFTRLPLKGIALADSFNVQSREQLDAIVQIIWERGGEGVIVKQRTAPYFPGKRTVAFLKMKQCVPGTLLVVGFVPSSGEIADRGPYATTVLRDNLGNHTVVKTLNDEELARLRKEGKGFEPQWETIKVGGRNVTMNVNHPWVHKKQRLCIEYHERTPDGSYRHPRWDRLENE